MTAADTLSRDEARRRAELLSDVACRVELDLTGSGETFTSDTRIVFACAEPGASTFVDLDAERVEHAELNGRPLPAEAFTGTRVTLDGLADRNELRVVAACRYQRTGVGLHRFTDPIDGAVYLHTQFEPFDAHRVYACFDQPDVKARFTLVVHAPAAWTCVSNGAVVEHDPREETARWRFAETPPLSSYLTALVAGPFHAVHDEHRGIPLGLYCRESLAAYLDAEELFALTRQGLDFFTDVFSAEYPYGKYDQLFVPEFNFGAMENAGCVTFSEGFVFRSKVTEASRQARAGTILHEMAHMWFGDLVTMRWWDDLWLNESFATYVGTLAEAEATRFTTAWAGFAQGIKAWALHQDQLPTTHPIAADIADTDAVRTHFDGITYAKGASVLKQLVAWVGRDAFVAGCRDYFARHAHDNAELADFLAALEATSGRDLGQWAKQWLQTAGVATLRAEATSRDGSLDRVTVTQEAPTEHPTLRDHRVALGCYALGDGALVRTHREELDVTGARTDVPALAGQPVPDLLLVNDDDLTFAKIRLDERSLATLEGHLSALSEPLARALCWGGAWDMVRDAELAARRWVGLVAEHGARAAGAGRAEELSVLQTLLRQAEAAIDRYGDPANRPAARAALAEAVRDALAGAEPGSDEQLVWARTLASLGQDRDWTWGLLTGETAVEGLAVDTDLRWHLVACLAAAGAADEDVIAAESARDPTDIGARRAAAARASRPTAEAKRTAWDALLTDRSLPLATMRALVGGFHQVDQEELLAAYVDAYVDALEGIWAERSPEEALLLTGGLYPSQLVDEETVAAADRALALSGLPAEGRRLVAESRDGTLRALRARAADRD